MEKFPSSIRLPPEFAVLSDLDMPLHLSTSFCLIYRILEIYRPQFYIIHVSLAEFHLIQVDDIFDVLNLIT